MPIAVLLLFLAPLPVAVVGMQQEQAKEQKVIEFVHKNLIQRRKYSSVKLF